jgi:hypothetical protein
MALFAQAMAEAFGYQRPAVEQPKTGAQFEEDGRRGYQTDVPTELVTPRGKLRQQAGFGGTIARAYIQRGAKGARRGEALAPTNTGGGRFCIGSGDQALA